MRCFLGFFSLVTLLSTSAAQAQDLDGAFRLSLDSNVLAYNATTQSAGDGGVETKSSRTSLGFSDAALGVGLGYGVTQSVAVGGRLLVSSAHSKVGEASADVASLSIVPQVAYLFLQGGAARPFIALHAGYSAGSSTSTGVEASTGTWLAGPGAGVHAFVAPTFSLDVGLQALLETGSSQLGDVSVETSGYSVALTVGLSGWLGTEKKQASAAAPESPEATVASTDPNAPVLSNFTLDLPAGDGGVQVALNGDPKLDPDRVQVAVTWRRSETRQACEAVAFETEQTPTSPLADVRSLTRGGFGSELESQLGTVPVATLRSLDDQAQRAWLTLCNERVVISLAAKGRVQQFLEDFERRLGKEESQ